MLNNEQLYTIGASIGSRRPHNSSQVSPPATPLSVQQQEKELLLMPASASAAAPAAADAAAAAAAGAGSKRFIHEGVHSARMPDSKTL